MATLIDDLLAYSHIERRHLLVSEVDVKATIAAMLAQYADEFASRQVSVKLAVPETRISVDSDGLLLVLRFADQAKDEVRLVAQNRRLQSFCLVQGRAARLVGRPVIAGVELEPRDEQLAQRDLALHARTGEELQRARARRTARSRRA